MEHNETQNQNVLSFDEQHIKSLELPALRDMLPMYDNKYDEVTTYLDELENKRNNLKQTLSGLEQRKSEIQKLYVRRKRFYEEIGIRGKEVQQELEKADVMCPIYEFKMAYFSRKASRLKSDKSIENNVSTDWHTIEDILEEQKRTLEDCIRNKQVTINNFVDKYLE